MAYPKCDITMLCIDGPFSSGNTAGVNSAAAEVIKLNSILPLLRSFLENLNIETSVLRCFFFFFSSYKLLGRINLRREGFMWAHGLRNQSVVAKKALRQEHEVSGSETHYIAEDGLDPLSLLLPSPACWGSNPGLHTCKTMCSISVVAAFWALTFLGCFKRVHVLCLSHLHILLYLSAPLAQFYCRPE